MKKIILLFMLLPMFASAQKFYTSSEVQIGWKYWSSETSWNFLIQNGKKVTLSCIPNIQWSGGGMTNSAEICATYIHDKKFVVITFSEEEGIRLRESNLNHKFSDLYSSIAYVSNQPWYEIDFENIIYDSTFNRIMIPCGMDYNGNNNAICIDFIDPLLSTKSITDDNNMVFDEEKVKFYNLQGYEVEPDKAKGQVVIKTDGKNSKKIYNK